MSPEKEQKGKRSRPAGASKGQRAGKTPQERSKLRSMLEYEGVTRSKGVKKSEAPAEKKAGRAQPRGGGKSRLRAIFEYEGVTRQEALTKEALRESEQKLRVILDSLAAGITITDLEGNIIEMNRGALRLHGFSSKEEVIGRNGLELIADKDRARAIENWPLGSKMIAQKRPLITTPCSRRTAASSRRRSANLCCATNTASLRASSPSPATSPSASVPRSWCGHPRPSCAPCSNR